MRVLLILSETPTSLRSGGSVAGRERAEMLAGLCDLHLAYIDWDRDGPTQVNLGNRSYICRPISPESQPPGLALPFRIRRRLHARLGSLTHSGPWFFGHFSSEGVRRQVGNYLSTIRPDAVHFDNMPSTLAWDACVGHRRLYYAHNVEAEIVQYTFAQGWLRALERSRMRKLIDTHDRFADRHLQYLRAGKKPEWSSTTVQGEREGLGRADVVLAIQSSEASEFNLMLEGRRVVLTVGHLLHATQPAVLGNLPRATFVASANSINVDAATAFVTQALPIIRARRPDFELILAGDVCAQLPDAHGVRKKTRSGRRCAQSLRKWHAGYQPGSHGDRVEHQNDGVPRTWYAARLYGVGQPRPGRLKESRICLRADGRCPANG